MKRFQKILFVHSEGPSNQAALDRAIGLALANQADLGTVSVTKRIPKIADIRKALVTYRREEVERALASAASATSLEVSTEHVEGEPFVEVVRKVLREDRDLVIKAAETDKGRPRRGFAAADLQLLRQCPCPVWLVKEAKKPREGFRILVAIDPVTDADDRLTRRLVEIAHAIHERAGEGATLDFLHCWELPHEGSFRHHPFLKMEADRLEELLAREETRHRQASENAVAKVVDGKSIRLFVEKGDPAELLPRFAEERRTDLVVMGTVGRTGIPGLFIGNTAETILRSVPCSVLAVKPAGFQSAVTLPSTTQ